MKKCIVALMGIYFLLNVIPAWGDATIETTVKIGGIKGMGASEGTQIRSYQGERMWESMTTKFTGAILSRLTSGSENITITRVDKGVYWMVDPKSRTYQEHSIIPPRPKSEEREKKEGKPTARVTKSEFNIKKTGASETINSFPCQEYLVTWLLEIEDLETRAKSRSLMETHLWTTPSTSTIQKAQMEEQKFNRALAKKIGDLSSEEAKQMGMTAFAAMSKASEDDIKKGLVRVKNEFTKIKGYPIRTVVGWSVEGDKEPGDSRGESSSQERPSGLSGGISGILTDIAGRIAQKKIEEKAAGDKGAPFFTSITEVKSIVANSVPSNTFEIPEGYNKKAE